MTDFEDDAIRALLETDDLPADAVPRLEEALRRADTRRDVDLAFRLRLKLFQDAYHDDLRELVAFAWCLAQFHREPQRFAFAAEDVVIGFNYLMRGIYIHPELSVEQLWKMLEQMKECLLRYGHTPRPVYEAAWRTGLFIGDGARMRRYHALWERAARDELTPCPACENDCRVEYWAYTNKHDKAVAAGERILLELEGCECVPNTLSRLLRCLVLLGRGEEADAAQRRSYRLICRDRDDDYLFSLAEHLAYLRHTANFAKGVALLEKALPKVLRTVDQDNRYRFFFAAAAFLARLAERRSTLTVRLPRSFPAYVESGRYHPAALAAWFDEQAADIGTRFDRRNGNSRYTRMAHEQLCY